MKSDIQNRDDIKLLTNLFYQRLLSDDLMEHFFEGVDLVNHMPILYDFWESVLFQVGKYKRNTFQKHLDIHMDHPLKAEHFDRWLTWFNQTVDEHFEGEKADHAKQTARSVASIIKTKIDNLEQWRLELNN